jgi:hypothetical protein
MHTCDARRADTHHVDSDSGALELIRRRLRDLRRVYLLKRRRQQHERHAEREQLRRRRDSCEEGKAENQTRRGGERERSLREAAL